MPLSDKARARLASDLARAVTRAAPDWTGTAPHDPGITMLELLAFVAEDLLYRRNALDPHARLIARSLAERAATLASAGPGMGTTDGAGTGTADDCGGVLSRVGYFSGQLLGADDFQAEQDYLRGRLARRNRALHGAGIVAGLEVTIGSDAGGARVVIAPGLAFAPDGEEIAVETPCTLALPATGAGGLVQVAYRVMPCRGVAAPAGTSFSRIAETFAASLSPTADPDAVVLARVARVRGRWRVDARFAPERVRR